MAQAGGTRPPATDRATPRSVSVIVPLLNQADHLAEQLAALASQSADTPWELVIADNGSRDGSVELARSWLPRFERARLIEATEVRNASHARNAGAAVAEGELLLFTDGDDVVQPGWLAGMARAARSGHVIAGAVDTSLLNAPGALEWHAIDPRRRALTGLRFLDYASGTNTGVWADVFHAIGGYDEATPVGEDIELSWRAQLSGYTLVHADDALVQYRLRCSVRELARQHFSYGQAGPHLYRRFRSAGMPGPDPLGSGRGWARVCLGWPGALASRRLRGRWALETAMKAGGVVSSMRERVVFV